MRKLLLGLALSTAISATAQTQTPSFVTKDLDQYIEDGIRDWSIPGLAIAIVKDGKVVYMKGFGVRDVATKEPVDENTLFMIASNSKLFTGTALAQLEYNQKLSLDDKITKFFPAYTLYDKNTTDLVTVRDMLTHHLGTKTFQGDFTFWNSSLSRRQIMDKMKLLKPVAGFRNSFGYCNSCFLTAGEVIPVVSGKPWEVYVYDSILMPLKMANTHTLGLGMSEMPNAARPYTSAFTGEVTPIPYDQVDNIGPAGSIVSNVKDLTHWLMFQLDSGRYEGKRIMPWAVLQRTREANTLTNKAGSVFYGLGVFQRYYQNRRVLWHTGGADGFVTNTCFVPEEGLGITILTNNDNQSFFELLRMQILDAYFGVPFVNKSKEALPGFKKEQAKTISDIKALQARVTGKAPALPVSAYTGSYKNELMGTIKITASGNVLNVELPDHGQLRARLEYMDNNEWLLSYNHIAFGIFPTKFKIQNNKVVSVDLKVSDFLEYDPYTFVKEN